MSGIFIINMAIGEDDNTISLGGQSGRRSVDADFTAAGFADLQALNDKLPGKSPPDFYVA